MNISVIGDYRQLLPVEPVAPVELLPNLDVVDDAVLD